MQVNPNENEPQSADPTAAGIPPWLLPFLVPAAGGALFGYDIGASSALVRILGEKQTLFGTLDPVQLGLVASGSLFGAVAASAALIFIGDRYFGRKQELVASGVLYTLGTALQAASSSFGMLIGSRILYGLGIGTAMHAAPLYIAETAPSELRGKLVSLKEAAIVLGIVAGYATGAAFGDEGAWRNVLAAALPIEAAMILGTAFIPESARWLSLRGRTEEAEAAVRALSKVSSEEAKIQVNSMTSMVDLKEKLSFQESFSRLVSDATNRKALTIGVGLVLFQQLSGQPSVLYYANRIFERAGLGFEAAVGVGLFKALMTLISVNLVEDPKWGRRPLLLLGTSGMAVSLLALAALFSGGADSVNQSAVIASIVAYVGCYQIGFGPITWLILSEVFPLKIRAAAVSVGTLANFGSNVLVTLAFESERQSLGETLLFLQFAAIAVAAVAFEFKLVPETRGLTLEQIEEKIRGD